ncbi:hypothetical protein MJL48_30820, partial [Salmonella enterica subsp. enterica serovar Kentucky]|nr:hypothetical protein [Salmonella enterica subsp. enterica serovar Kentucky]
MTWATAPSNAGAAPPLTPPHFNPVPVSNKKFVFDDFILNMDGSLLRSEKKVNIPPKEYAV